MKYIDADRLKEEFQKRFDICKKVSEDDRNALDTQDWYRGKYTAYSECLSFIDSLQQEPNAYEDAMLEVKEYVDKLYDNASIGLNEYDSGLYNGIAETCMKLRGFIKARTSREQPEVDLEKEIIRYQREDMDRDTTVGNVARHFYELGQRDAANKFDEIEYNRQKAEEEILDKSLDEVAEEYSKRVSDGHNYRDLTCGFIAGAKWMAGQGYTTEETVYYERLCDETRIMVDFGRDGERGGFNPGDKVIVQIRRR